MKTTFSALTRVQAAVVMAAAAVFLVWCVLAVRGGPLEIRNTTPKSDGRMYHSVVQRLHAGEGYYDSLGSELRKGEYASRSVFNWRTPFHLMAVAAMTEPVSRYVLAGLALIASLLAGIATNRGGGLGVLQFIVTMLALSECFIFNQSFNFHLIAEVWAGALITISVGAYAFGWWPAGVGAGIVALFIRELALPYAVVSWLIALRKRNMPELYAWTAGLVGWTVYFLVHAHLAMSHITEHDIVLRVGWIHFGGPRFLVETVRMSLLNALPTWVAAAILPVILLGTAGWATSIGRRVAAVDVGYMAAYSIVGLPVDLYWGAITNPLLAFGLVWSVPALRDLFRALLRSRGPVATIEGGATMRHVGEAAA